MKKLMVICMLVVFVFYISGPSIALAKNPLLGGLILGSMLIYYLVEHSYQPGPNQAVVEINSEPSGARVYSKTGGYEGVTPLTLTYKFEDDDYARGRMICDPLTCFHENHLPQNVQMELKCPGLEIPRDTKKKIKYSQLFILERDPKAPQSSQVQQKIDITTRQEDSTLDRALKTMNLFLIIQSLQPVR